MATLTAKESKPEQRIDYILYSGSQNFAVKNYSVMKEDKYAGEGKISLSDHCLLEVDFDLKNELPAEFESSEEQGEGTNSTEQQCELIKKSIAVLSKDIHYTKRSQKRHIILSAITILLFLGITIVVFPWF